MKLFLINNIEVVFSFITILVTWIVGFITKNKTNLNNKIIPIQNIIIMIISSGIYYWATRDFSIIIASGSPIATLFYDTVHLLRKEN